MSPVALLPYAAGGAVVVGGLWALDRLANAIVRPVPRPPDRDVAELAVEHEDVRIPSGDHELAGWLLCPPGREGRPLVLLVHGWGASYGPLLHLAEPLARAGYPVLLFDVRGHGRNREVPYVTARHFRDDIMAACVYAARRFPERPLVLMGHSMGGAGAVLAAAEGAAVNAIVTLAAPADVLEVTAGYLSDRGLPGGVLVRVLRPFWWRRVGGTFGPLTPERRIGELTVPVLVVQPERDRRVSMDHAERLARAGGAELRVIAGAGHTDVLEREETHRAVLEWLDGRFGGPADPPPQ